MGVSYFSPPPTGANEAERERAVIESGAIDARGDTVLGTICVELCRQVRGKAALLSILYGETQYVIAAHGFAIGAYSRKNSLSGHALYADDDLFVVPDLAADKRFAENPWVNGEVARFRFYTASLIRPHGRLPVGVISVLDDKPRPSISPAEREVMLAAAADMAARIVQISQDRNTAPVPD
ncbi:hypothetical protein ASE70_12915 [Sphingomonas sp. Leaf22]|uniref:GAF domain-containing protein n=1 Tax=Sphingomonas sp. Leaf22 TaxID=1735687 RepID=UPI0006F760E9|nr:GAF domain-containing protein [Sphingomonas sp. Leaf22]KQM93634.1 hypothetical protein ASE70_12915 [Sphingomonas sp. Leaf22]